LLGQSVLRVQLVALALLVLVELAAPVDLLAVQVTLATRMGKSNS
jgi:hypothetical protein